MRKSLLSIAIPIVLTACSSTPIEPAKAPAAAPAAAQSHSPGPTAAAQTRAAPSAASIPAHLDPSSPLVRAAPT